MTAASPLAALGDTVDALTPDLLELRRDLHAHPELSRRETRTTSIIEGVFAARGVEVRPLPGTGLLVDLGPADAGRRVALRADMDALPVRERTGLPFSSSVEGVCHACGHDVHTAAVLGAGLVLHEHADLLARSGTAVRLVFQPAEEVIPGGAVDAIAAGALEGVDAAYAVHCDPGLDVGRVGLRDGPITAAADPVSVYLSGRGGHTSRPHLTEDLTFALAKVVTEVPAALSRRLDPRAGAALVWGVIQAGRASNVIPSSGEARGTLRMLDAATWDTVGPLLTEVVESVVRPYGVTARVEHTRGVPPVVNDAGAVEALRAAATGLGLVADGTSQSLGGEDFSWYLGRVPGAMARLGTRTPGGVTYDLHQGNLVVDEAAVPAATRLLAGACLAGRLPAPTADAGAGHGSVADR